jgi:thymidylate kinase
MHKIHSSDLALLLHLFAEKHHAVHLDDADGRIIQDAHLTGTAAGDRGQKVRVRTSVSNTPQGEPLIIDLGETPAIDGYQRTVLHVIRHGDGRIRWLHPPGKLSAILHFHSAAGTRGKLLAAGVRMLCALRLDHLVRAGTLTLHHHKRTKFRSILQKVEHDDCAYFLGTPGAQRKPTVVLLAGSKVVAFAKTALNQDTFDLIRNEKKALHDLKGRACRAFSAPTAIDVGEPAILLQTSVFSRRHWRSTTFTEAHGRALADLYEGRIAQGEQEARRVKEDLEARLNHIAGLRPTGVISRLHRQLMSALEQDTTRLTHVMAPAHGDLTPWNLYCTPDGPAIYDWEMYREKAPMLHDLVHFHLQQGIIVEQLPYHVIQARIRSACALPSIRKCIVDHGIDIDVCIRTYLLNAVSQFLLVYSRQSILSDTQIRQLFAWARIVGSEFGAPPTVDTHRAGFLEDLGLLLKGRPHAFLKYRWDNLEQLPITSDLDIAVDRGTARRLADLCAGHPFIAHMRCVHRSFMSTVGLYFKDGSFLSLDLIHRAQRKHLRLMDIPDLLAGAAPNAHGLMVPSFKHDLAYTFLFHVANGSSIPAKYAPLFERKDDREWHEAMAYLNSLCGLWFTTRAYLLQADAGPYMRHVRHALARRMGLTTHLREFLLYIADTALGIMHGRGFIMTFSGVDGAGKSTVISRVKEELEHTYRKEVVLMRHRPGLLPMLNAWRVGTRKAEELASVTPPRLGTNQGRASSLLRFTYYLFDYLVGQWVVYFRHVLRGRIVLYDRYYFDLMADPRRSNIDLDRSLVRALYALVHKPKLNFLLYADSATILQRKRELSGPDIEMLTLRYRELFERLGQRHGQEHYRSILNADLEDTMACIRKQFVNMARA